MFNKDFEYTHETFCQLVSLLNNNKVRYAITGKIWFAIKPEYSDVYKNNPGFDKISRDITVLVHPEDFYKVLALARNIPQDSILAKCVQADVDSWFIATKEADIKFGGIYIRVIKSVNHFGLYLDPACDGFYNTDYQLPTTAMILKPIDQLFWLMTADTLGHAYSDYSEFIKLLIHGISNKPADEAMLRWCVNTSNTEFTVFKANMQPYMHLIK